LFDQTRPSRRPDLRLAGANAHSGGQGRPKAVAQRRAASLTVASTTAPSTRRTTRPGSTSGLDPIVAAYRRIFVAANTMAYHRFRIGERVVALAFGVPPGPYEITRVLPLVDGGPFYRGKSVADGRERALSELSLRRPPAAANSNRTPIPRPNSPPIKSRAR